MFLTTVRVRRARRETCAAHNVPYVEHLAEVMVHGKVRAIVTVESSSGRIATVEWAEADFPTAKIVKVATAAVALMRLVEPAAAAA
jgi:hypothetical protein